MVSSASTSVRPPVSPLGAAPLSCPVLDAGVEGASLLDEDACAFVVDRDDAV
jgi:hypothetical protein